LLSLSLGCSFSLKVLYNELDDDTNGGNNELNSTDSESDITISNKFDSLNLFKDYVMECLAY
jgi:hypothetical protein